MRRNEVGGRGMDYEGNRVWGVGKGGKVRRGHIGKGEHVLGGNGVRGIGKGDMGLGNGTYDSSEKKTLGVKTRSKINCQ